VQLLFVNPLFLIGLFSMPMKKVNHRYFSMKMKKNTGLSYPLSKHNFGMHDWNYQARTENQQLYINHLINPNVTILAGLGPAGTGKTLFACNAAVGALKTGFVDRIVITRPLISVDEEELGFLPGTIANKMDPWTRPIFDILKESFSPTQIQSMIANGVIEIAPLAFMRGRTFKRAFIIADEMQNSSPTQMLLMLTRIGEESKLVITGDLNQSDRPTGINGLADFVQKIKKAKDNNDMIKIVELNHQDIQRSLVVARILDIYNMKSLSHNKLASNISTVLNATVVEYRDADRVVAVSADTSANESLNKTLIIDCESDSTSSDAALIPKHLYAKLEKYTPFNN
jgi:phosphate starvation-inducible PhoH-like protein